MTEAEIGSFYGEYAGTATDRRSIGGSANAANRDLGGKYVDL